MQLKRQDYRENLKAKNFLDHNFPYAILFLEEQYNKTLWCVKRKIGTSKLGQIWQFLLTNSYEYPLIPT